MSDWRFRPIARSNFAQLSSWLREPHVARWWADDATLEGVEADYGPNVDGTEPSQVFIAARGGEDVGLVQRYCIAAYPQYVAELEAVVKVDTGTWSMDYLLGPPQALRRGWGVAMLTEFVEATWRETDAACLLVPVHAENVASWRALERCGFRRVAEGELTPDNPADSRAHFVYRLART